MELSLPKGCFIKCNVSKDVWVIHVFRAPFMEKELPNAIFEITAEVAVSIPPSIF
jgi:hypothetical protein